jgi:hypothetical protein
MGFFGAVFVSLTLKLQLGWTGIALGLPFLIFGLILLAAVAVIRRPGDRIRPTPRQDRILLWSSTGEGIGLFIAANVAVNLGHADMLLPAMALVVGLHFLPMGYGFPFRPYTLLGFALLAASALGFVLAAPLGGMVAGVAAGLALWVASGLAVRRDWRTKAS